MEIGRHIDYLMQIMVEGICLKSGSSFTLETIFGQR